MKACDAEPTEKQIGTCKCEVCGAMGKLILREGKQFRYWYCECPKGMEIVFDISELTAI